jgi:hypothetical protein
LASFLKFEANGDTWRVAGKVNEKTDLFVYEFLKEVKLVA